MGDNVGRIDEYYQAATDDEEDVEISLAGFLTFIDCGRIRSLSGNTEWYTPEVFIRSARKVMGSIDLDPASNEHAQAIVQAKRFFTEEDDGLDHDWGGNVFLNPPFKMPLVAEFVGRLAADYNTGLVKQGVLLTNNATDTSWWHAALESATAICFTRGRISFYSPEGESKSPTNGQTFLYFGPKVGEFCEEFAAHGSCCVLRKAG